MDGGYEGFGLAGANRHLQVALYPVLADQPLDAQLEDRGQQRRVVEHGDHYDRDGRITPAQLLDQADAIGLLAVGHHQVGDDQVTGLFGQQLEKPFDILGFTDDLQRAVAAERRSDADQCQQVIVDDYYFPLHLGRGPVRA
ncbi:hypothetical protein C4K20_5330 [Pseudomonas chlororaphis subsp. aurantiaca]|nr:hypothetical protein C4K20_5330 [Pseudomonas chlororaphis subsp. aurantiaca]